jgi:hypothetical protein
MRLRYSGRCASCGSELAAGTPAIYDKANRAITCEICPGPEGESRVRDARKTELVREPVVSGHAGASAQREHDRRSSKRESRIRQRHPVLGGLILAATDNPQTTKAWATGARGEERVGRVLDALAGPDLRLLHDRKIPRSRANIDHIVVCASGVYVIDAKKYKGRPTLRVEGGLIRPRSEKLLVGSRNHTQLVIGVQEQVSKVEGTLRSAGLPGVPVLGMLCFVDADWPLLGGDFTIGGVTVLWPRRATKYLVRAGPLAPDQIDRVFRTIGSVFKPA